MSDVAKLRKLIESPERLSLISKTRRVEIAAQEIGASWRTVWAWLYEGVNPRPIYGGHIRRYITRHSA